MEKVFRDPVHNMIRFDMDRDRLLLALIDTSEVQRLRSIRQMGVSDFIYPGATHSRFSHSLGAAHLMRRVVERMGLLREDPQYARIARSLEEHRELLLASALLHDIGHFPFSHLLEEVIRVDHEAWSVRLILDPQSDVHQVLSAHDPSYPEHVARILERRFKPSYVVKLISSQLDVDRMDYLLRDSVYTGVGYGKFDLDWLLHSLRIVQLGEDYEVAVDAHKGIQVAESYVLARYYMYQQVYHHKTERAVGALLLKLLQRARTLLAQGRLVHTPEAVKALLQRPQALDTPTFLKLDDALLSYALSLWARSTDEVLADLSQRFLSRRVFKTTILDEERFKQLRPALTRLAEGAGFDPNYYLVMDTAQDSPYKEPYWTDQGTEVGEHVFVVDDDGRLADLSERSDLIQALRNRPISVQRLCYPAALRQPLLALIAP